MTTLQYRELALAWRPGTRNDSWFVAATILTIGLALCLGFLISRMDIPVEPRTKVRAPERVARFITESREKKLPEPVVRKPEKPARKTSIPPPRVKPSREDAKPATVSRQPRPSTRTEPLSEPQRQARETAAGSGLMKEMAVLQELADTGDLAGQLSGPVRSGPPAVTASAGPRMRSAARDSGALDVSQHRVEAAGTELSGREMTEVQDALDANAGTVAATPPPDAPAEERRSQEEVTLIVDRHKGQLQALYNRARRTTPSIRGTLVVALTIAPDGSVTRAEIVSSELKDPALERSILGRLKALQFGAKKVPAITVHYPIEFLP